MAKKMYIADLHIHSRYSRATSRDCTPEHLDLWARRKGIHIVGSGDFTHPAWREELKEKLEPAEDGLYVLKEEYRIEDKTIEKADTPRFVITGEISSIYKKNDRVRKVHSLILLPGLEDAERVSEKLEEIGNIHSDGRPILGLSCHDLLEILLELSPESVYVPAHIWTPHFSLFGAFSGFDTVEECYEDLTCYIHAMETGLSSDPPMNWRVSALDKYHLISNSDAHSPAKLGREATLLEIELSYEGLKEAIQEGKGLYGTIEFFPEEGKYHMDGHRKCNLCLTPLDTEKYKGICPVCGRKITIGVSHRVEQLADRADGFVRADARAFESMVPLPEVIGASYGQSASSKKVQKEYMNLLEKLGPEFEILRKIPLEDIRKASGDLVTEGISRLRRGRVERIPGYDGEYGIIRLFQPDEIANVGGQMDFFSMLGVDLSSGEKIKSEMKAETAENVEKSGERGKADDVGIAEDKEGSPSLNPEQKRAVEAVARRIAVIAGPGTGKTKTLVSRILYLLENRKVRPSEITAVTFTNQAAGEMKERLEAGLGGTPAKKRQVKSMQIGTFHAICLSFLKKQGLVFSLCVEAEAREMAEEAMANTGLSMPPKKFLEAVSREKSGMKLTEEYISEQEEKLYRQTTDLYEDIKRQRCLLDFDDLLLETVRRIEKGDVKPGWEQPFSYLFIDEFQDMNPLQYRLMKAWNEKGRELFVIGDPDQSIYGFRGADAACFERLAEDGGELEIIALKENYRSTPEILRASLKVIGENPGGERILNANLKSGDAVRLVHGNGAMSEAIFAAKEINRLVGGIGMLEAHAAAEKREAKPVRGFDDIAVLTRTHRQMELLEKCLRTEGIPYIVAGKESFLEHPKVQGSLCFFRYLNGGEDVQAKKECAKLLWNLDWNPVTEGVVDALAEAYRPLYEKKKPEAFLKQWLTEWDGDGKAELEKLKKMAVFYSTMEELRAALTLGVESDLKRCGGKDYKAGAVTLMTLHGSKGLEFPCVIICGAAEGSIPLESERYPTDFEEERRLLYVGMTRAKEELILTCAGEESVFLKPLSEELLAREEARKPEKKEEFHQMSLFE